MPNTTQNYGFKKPYYTENADIEVINENYDTLDEALMVTLDQNSAPPTTNTKSKLSVVLSWITNRIKAITGKANWWETPSTNLENCYSHINNGTHPNATSSSNGFMSLADKQKLDNAVSANTASRLVIRDASGRAQVSNPAASLDIANKDYVDNNFVRLNADNTMNAKLVAQSNTAYSTRQVRNVVIWTSGDNPPATAYGDILVKTF